MKRRARKPITEETRQRLREGQLRGWADPVRAEERKATLRALHQRNKLWAARRANAN